MKKCMVIINLTMGLDEAGIIQLMLENLYMKEIKTRRRIDNSKATPISMKERKEDIHKAIRLFFVPSNDL